MQREIDMLERDLVQLASAMAYPSTPDIAGAVRGRLSRPLPAAPAPRWSLAGVGLAALIVAAAVVLGTAAPARDAVADLFHRINIFETAQSPVGLSRDITGTEVSLVDAQTEFRGGLKLPDYPARTSPERVLLQNYGTVNVAVLFFRLPDGRTYALFETNTSVGKGVPAFGKGIPASGATVESVSGLGDEAYWVQGLRITQYYDANGNVIPESVRATDVNTLLWSRSGFVYRIEGPLTREEAIAVALSLR